MIGLTYSEFFSALLSVAIVYIAILALRLQSRRQEHEWNISKQQLFHCDSCHYVFVSKEAVTLCRCPRCNAICIRKRRKI